MPSKEPGQDAKGKYWRVRWRDPDGRQRKKKFRTEKAADRFALEVEDTVRSGRRWKPVDARPRASIGEAVSAYLVHLHTRRSPRTLRNVGNALQVFTNFLGDSTRVFIDTLSIGLLERFYVWSGENTGRHGNTRTLDTRKKYVGDVQNFWKWCANSEAYSSITPPPRHLDDLPNDPKTPTTAPTWEEMDACIAASFPLPKPDSKRRLPVHYPLALAVMRALGVRVWQAEMLIVEDIDIEAEHFRFRGELGKTKEERAGRITPLPPALLPFFARLVEGRDKREWLLPIPSYGKRGRHLRAEYVNTSWARAGVRKEAWEGMPDHCFRKGFKSGLVRAGVDDKTAESLIGHSMGLSGIYTDPNARPMRDAVSKVPAFSDAAQTTINRAFAECFTSSRSRSIPKR